MIIQSPLDFNIYQTNHIMELVNEWFPTGIFRKFDTPFWTESTYVKEIMAAISLTVNYLNK